MRFLAGLTIWLLLLLVAFAVDVPVAGFVRDAGWEAFIERDRGLREFLKLPGEFLVVFLCAVAATLLHRRRWQAGLFILATAVASGLNGIVKWMVGRHRPFTWMHETAPELRAFEFLPFRGGWEGLFVGRNLSFPSGHATTAFALASALAMLWPRGRWVWFTAAGLCGFERIWENAHYLSEVVAGAGLGIGLVHLAGRWMPERFWMSGEAISNQTTAPVTRSPVMVEVAPVDSVRPYLSLVIPAYNEQENVPTLLSRVEASLSQIGKPYEVLIVDDGSTDQTPQLLSEAMARLPWLRVLRMQKNAGQSAAFEAGFEAARGELIATIDADLQNDPEEIPRLLPLLDEKNVDMITGWRKDRQDTSFRRWQSRQANRIRNWISQETVNDSASSLKLYRAHAVKGLRLFNGAHRFFPTLVKMRGYTCYETPVKHSHRFAGTAKYGFRNRAFRAFVDLLAVRWMKTRFLRYHAAEVRREAGSSR
jgi:membrane-associated phospholipid phosphatase